MIIGEFDNSCEIVMRLGITAGSGQCRELLPSEPEIVNITNYLIGTISVGETLRRNRQWDTNGGFFIRILKVIRRLQRIKFLEAKIENWFSLELSPSSKFNYSFSIDLSPAGTKHS